MTDEEFISILPAAVDPEPVGRVAAHGGFKRAVHVAHDVRDGPRAGRFRAWEFRRRLRSAILPGRCDSRWRCAAGNGNAGRKPPARWRCRSRGRETACARLCELWSASRPSSRPVSFIAALSAAPSVRRSKKRQPVRFAQLLHEPVERRLFQRAIGRGALEDGHELAEPGVKLEVAEMADGHDPALRAGVGLVRQDVFGASVRSKCGSICHGVIAAVLTAPAKFSPMRRKFSRASARISAGDFSWPKHIVQIFQRHAPVPRVEPERQRAAGPAEPRHPRQRQRLQRTRPAARRANKAACPFQRKQILRTQS